MAKSNYLSIILFITAVWLYSNTGSNNLRNNIKSNDDKSYWLAQSTESLTAKRLLLQAVYTAEIGVREESNRNDGIRVERYLDYTGNQKGDAWCASFVCWAMGKAGIDNPQSGWSPHLLPSSRWVWENSWTKERGSPQQGNVFGIWFKDKNRIAHCGFIDAWGASHVITVEGNTNGSGSREGDGIYRKRRLKKSLYVVADWLSRKEKVNEV